MSNDWIKISAMAKELNLSHKTIYNWINQQLLFTPKPGYVSRAEAYATSLRMKVLRQTQSKALMSAGVSRDPNGRFTSPPDIA
jgi:transposase